MRPADLPDRSFVRLKCDLSALLSIITHTANLQEALAVAASDLGAIVVELAIIDVVFMLSVYAEDIILRCRGHLLATIHRLLLMLSLRVVRLLWRCHHLVVRLLRCVADAAMLHVIVLRILSVHFSFVSILNFPTIE